MPARPQVTSVLTLLLAAILLAFATPDVRAQGVKKGDWFEDTTRIGFRIRSPKGWRFVPANLGDPVEIGRFVPENYPYINVGGRTWEVTNWLLEFDLARLRQERIERLKQRLDVDDLAEVDEDVDLAAIVPEVDLEAVLDTWVQRNVNATGWTRTDEEEERFGKIDGRKLTYTGQLPTPQGNEDVCVYLALIPVSEERWVATAFNTTADDFRKEARGFEKLADSFQRLELEEFEYDHDGPRDFRSAKRAELAKSIQNMPGWWMHETENFFVLSDSDDHPFIEEIGARLEAIRSIYTADYPADKARRIASDDGGDGRTVATVDTLQQSRLSVVRVCSDRSMYMQYGGPPSSAGYWSSYHEELVFFDDKKGGGRNKTFAVLNHEAFHQYIFYFYGNLAPHSWYNEGTGDFYSGYQFNPKRSRFSLTPFSWRRQLAKDNIRKGDYVPLEQFVRMSQRQYYGSNDWGLGGGDCYAQGWSFIWFLRQGAGKPKNWDPAWEGILDTYLAELARTGDLDEAVDVAFEGVDWEALEECWMAYVG